MTVIISYMYCAYVRHKPAESYHKAVEYAVT
jgi:hypothetical protein